jgi:2-methylfumaryl-CoA hydratase
MVRKRDKASPAPEAVTPDLPAAVGPENFTLPAALDLADYDTVLAGSAHLWDDYAVGERIDHVDGMTLEESDHMTATRLYQNNAKVHFNRHSETKGRFGKRLIYGGHIISLARALSFNGLANAFRIAAIHGGRHVAPSFAGDTIYAWSEVVGKSALAGRGDLGALRLRTIAAKDHPCTDFPKAGADGKYPAPVVLDLDYSVLMPRGRAGRRRGH